MTDVDSGQNSSFLTAVAKGLNEAAASPVAGATIVVALSGGIDSTALLLALSNLKDKLAIDLKACHVNHHLRIPDSDEDENFCRELCRRLAVSLTCEHVNFEIASQSEEQLRLARYAKLVACANDVGAKFIATAHTADDQVETLLFRLFRGTGRHGFLAMRPVRTLNNIRLIRPLLKLRRADCVNYLQENSITARYDRSNEDQKYTRNFLRHKVLPVVEERFPEYKTNLLKFQQILADEELLLNKIAAGELLNLTNESRENNRWQKTSFMQLDLALKRRVIWKALTDKGVEPSFERIAAIIHAIENNSAISLNETWDLRAQNGLICFIDKSQVSSPMFAEVELKIPGMSIVPSLNSAVKVESWQNSSDDLTFPPAHSLVCLADLANTDGPLVVRARKAGDVIRPFGMDELVKLKKYLHNHQSPLDINPLQNIVIADQHEVIWVPGVGLSNKVRVKIRPSHKLSWLKLPSDETALC